jgi:hypothetical protein
MSGGGGLTVGEVIELLNRYPPGARLFVTYDPGQPFDLEVTGAYSRSEFAVSHLVLEDAAAPEGDVVYLKARLSRRGQE